MLSNIMCIQEAMAFVAVHHVLASLRAVKTQEVEMTTRVVVLSVDQTLAEIVDTGSGCHGREPQWCRHARAELINIQ